VILTGGKIKPKKNKQKQTKNKIKIEWGVGFGKIVVIYCKYSQNCKYMVKLPTLFFNLVVRFES